MASEALEPPPSQVCLFGSCVCVFLCLYVCVCLCLRVFDACMCLCVFVSSQFIAIIDTNVILFIDTLQQPLALRTSLVEEQ